MQHYTNHFEPDANSRPGIYLGVTKNGDRYFPIVTVVYPQEMREKGFPAFQTGKVKDHPGSEDLMEMEAYVRGELTEKVRDMMGEHFGGISELQPTGAA
jgi:hypothetical protein